ncbi:MAG: hypothetical protein K0S27_1 [Gammaproteobacteria bacterium]|jgi:hypothetical protein|nr:hypothetical protein [Gammaproteobacteria bacterium]
MIINPLQVREIIMNNRDHKQEEEKQDESSSKEILSAIISIISAFNGFAVRGHQLEEFFQEQYGQQLTLIEIVFYIINFLSLFPEYAYNFNRNSEVKESINTISQADNKILPIIAATLAAIGVGVAHGFIYYASHEEDYIEKNGPGAVTALPFSIFLILSTLGGIQEFFHGGIELAEAASQTHPVPLFYNSDTDTIFGPIEHAIQNLGGDGFINFVLCTAALGEFSLFYQEIDHLFPDGYQYGLEFLSVVCASMYLVHEGHMLLELIERPTEIISSRIKNDFSYAWKAGAVSFLMMSMLNAFVTGLAKYQALTHLLPECPMLIRATAGAASGLSRLATLGMCANHFEQKIHENRSLKYTALQQGRDVLYEAVFIALMNLMVTQANLRINADTVLVWGVISGFISEVAIIFSEVIQKFDRSDKVHFDNHMITNLFVDCAAGPFLSLGTFCYLTAHRPDIDNYHKSTATVMITLILRHFLKKILDCCPNDKYNKPDRKDPNQVPNENRGNERDPLLPPVNTDSAPHNDNNHGANNIEALHRKTSMSFCDHVSAFMGGFFYHGNHFAKPPNSTQAISASNTGEAELVIARSVRNTI